MISGLYAITPEEPETAVLCAKVRLALTGGARIVQYRAKGLDRAAQRAQAESLLSLCRPLGALFIINDDPALAAEIGADGVHLGQDDSTIANARRLLGARRIIGASCYNRLAAAEAAAAAGADYIAFGSFFPSSTKPAAIAAPLTLLQQAKQRLTAPLVAIGGLNLDNSGKLIAAGADALAVISALFGSRDIHGAARKFAALFGNITA
ncbi:MAG TPA: thiamine phosphate synthase [Betaproteobacteria bacterium]|nr:thiamine phosphate synthase [Betaproteobacteria bacterium]